MNLREGVKKEIWKFFMTVAIKRGEGGAQECHKIISKFVLYENCLESFPDCRNVFCTYLGLYFLYDYI